MLRAEAAWLARRLDALPADDLSPLLSIGSGHAELRATQPWLDRLVYEPLARRGVRVLHHELEPAPGVDVAGDLTDPALLERLAELELRAAMCCNVLEHVPRPAEVAAAIERVVPPGGYAFLTVPRRFPYHPGPIDTMLRPSPHDLRGLFPALEEVESAEIRCESLLAYLLRSPTKWTSLARGARSLAGPRAEAPDVPLRDKARMLFVSTAVSAVILRRPWTSRSSSRA
jgi:SAM-dependent methyltransferase